MTMKKVVRFNLFALVLQKLATRELLIAESHWPPQFGDRCSREKPAIAEADHLH